MNDLEDHLTDLLTRVAGDVVMRPDLDAVVDQVAVVVDRSAPSRRRRFDLVLVAAALVVAAVVVVADRADHDRPVSTSPSVGAFPVLDGLPKEVDRAARADLLSIGPAAQFARAVVGRRSGDTVTDLVLVYAYRERVTPGATLVGREPPGAMGLGADRYDGGTAQILKVDDTGIVLSGVEPQVLFRATPITARWDDHLRVERLALGDLPPGYEVIIPPGPPTFARRQASVTAHPDGELLFVEVGVDPVAVLGVAMVPGMRAVSIAGRPGWLVEDSTGATIVWSPDDTHHALLRTTLHADAALAAAARVRFVDEATWRQRYDVSDGARGTATTPAP